MLIKKIEGQKTITSGFASAEHLYIVGSAESTEALADYTVRTIGPGMTKAYTQPLLLASPLVGTVYRFFHEDAAVSYATVARVDDRQCLPKGITVNAGNQLVISYSGQGSAAIGIAADLEVEGDRFHVPARAFNNLEGGHIIYSSDRDLTQNPVFIKNRVAIQSRLA